MHDVNVIHVFVLCSILYIYYSEVILIMTTYMVDYFYTWSLVDVYLKIILNFIDDVIF